MIYVSQTTLYNFTVTTNPPGHKYVYAIAPMNGGRFGKVDFTNAHRTGVQTTPQTFQFTLTPGFHQIVGASGTALNDLHTITFTS